MTSTAIFTAIFFTLLLAAHPILSADPPQPAPSPAPAPPTAGVSPSPFAPSNSPPSPPSNPSPSPNSPAPSPTDDGGNRPDSPSPAPGAPADLNHENHSGKHDSNVDESSGGMSSAKKAGIAVGVIMAVGIVVVGVFVYKKRQQNIRRSQFGYGGP